MKTISQQFSSCKLRLIKMPVLSCPLGTGCTKGPNNGIWITPEIELFEEAKQLLDDHVKLSHPAVTVEPMASTIYKDLKKGLTKITEVISVDYENLSKQPKFGKHSITILCSNCNNQVTTRVHVNTSCCCCAGEPDVCEHYCPKCG